MSLRVLDYAVFLLGILGIPAIAIFSLGLKQSTSRLPPSPPGDFIIGHARQVPLEYSWETFSKWRKALGGVIYIHIFGRPMLVINSTAVARDLFEARGANFSSRPHLVVINDLMDMGSGLPFLPHGDRWRKQRRFIQRYFDPQGVKGFRPAQEEQVQLFLEELLSAPQDFAHSIERLASRLVMKIIYGYNATGRRDRLLEKFAQVASLFTQFGEAGGSILDLIPALRHFPTWLPEWVPGVSVKRHALYVRKLLEEIKDEPLKELLMKRALGVVEPCFLNKILDDYASTDSQDTELGTDVRSIGLLTSMAGFDTTAAAVSTFFLMMAIHPEVVERAQSEIDQVTGSERFPTLEDRGKLPFIDCIVKEVYRIHPVTPINIPHLSVDATEYGNWTIPAGTSCVANIWGMMHDEDIFHSPDAFKPERHLNLVLGGSGKRNVEKEPSALEDNDPNNIIFGFGRRICPGRFYADANVWLVVAKVLAAFNIGPYIEPSTGERTYPQAVFQPYLVSGPKDFKCAIEPRSAEHENLIRKEANDYIRCTG